MKVNSERNLFDIPENINYLNCAFLSPQLRTVSKTGAHAVLLKSNAWDIQPAAWFNDAEVLRSLAGRIINADTEEMALIPSVSYGISIAAANVPVKSGQQIVVMDQEFPSNYYSWKELARENGAEILTVVKGGRTWTEAIIEAITGRTAVVAIANCHWTNGANVDLEEIGKKARSVGACYVIDASQAMGACPIDVQKIQPDFLVSVGYKWLLGPCGLGYLYVAPRWRAEGRPIEYSWLNKNGSENFAELVNYRDDFRPGARRFDIGEFSGSIHILMAIDALTQVLDWGVENIHNRLKILTGRLALAAENMGLIIPKAHERAGHMIGIDLPDGVSEQMKEALKSVGIYVSYRGKSIRVSPYLYTDTADIEQLVTVIGQNL